MYNKVKEQKIEALFTKIGIVVTFVGIGYFIGAFHNEAKVKNEIEQRYINVHDTASDTEVEDMLYIIEGENLDFMGNKK